MFRTSKIEEKEGKKLTIDHTPTKLPAWNALSVNGHKLLASHNCEGDQVLKNSNSPPPSESHDINNKIKTKRLSPYRNDLVRGHTLRVVVRKVGGVHTDLVELDLLVNPPLELRALLWGQRVGLADDGHQVGHLTQVLHGLNIKGLQSGK